MGPSIQDYWWVFFLLMLFFFNTIFGVKIKIYNSNAFHRAPVIYIFSRDIFCSVQDGALDKKNPGYVDAQTTLTST